MGCFNTMGFHSNTMILSNQETVVFITATIKGNTIPICPPIFGTYDDYGSVENTNDEKYYKKYYIEICEYFNSESIEELLTCIKDNDGDREDVKRYGEGLSYNKIRKKILEDLYLKEQYLKDSILEEELSIDIILDHKLVFDHYVEVYDSFHNYYNNQEWYVSNLENAKNSIEKAKKIKNTFFIENSIETFLSRNFTVTIDNIKKYGELVLTKGNSFPSGYYSILSAALCIKNKEFIKQNPEEFIEYSKFLRGFADCGGYFITIHFGTQTEFYHHKIKLFSSLKNLMEIRAKKYKNNPNII